MFIPYTKAQRIDESLGVFVAGRDGCTANAEHGRQQQRHIYVVYVPPHGPCPWFGMSVMFRAMGSWSLVSTNLYFKISGVLGPKVCISGSWPAFWMRFFAHYLSGTMSWGLKPCFSALESRRMTPFFIPYLWVRICTLGWLNIQLWSSWMWVVKIVAC